MHLCSVLATTDPSRQLARRRECAPFRAFARSEPFRLRVQRTGHSSRDHLTGDRYFTNWANGTPRWSNDSAVFRKSLSVNVFGRLGTFPPLSPTRRPDKDPNLGSVAGPNLTLSIREGEGVATVAAAVTPMENDQPASKSEEQTQMHTDRSEHHSPGRYPANVWLFNEMERNGNDSGGGSVAVQPESLLCFKPPRAAYTPSSKERVDHYDPVRAAAG